MPRGRQPEGEPPSATPNGRPDIAPGELAQPPVAMIRTAGRRGDSRSKRWNDTVAELVALQAEYAAWYDALPDSLRDSATAEALQAIVDLDLDALTAVQPPRGYGRD